MLNAEQVDKIRLLLTSSAWNEVVRPALGNRADQALKALVLDPSERSGEWQGRSDESIRGAIREMQWMSAAWANEVAVFEYNRQREELAQQALGEPEGLQAPPTGNP
jgi:hypothetical protein